MVSGTKNRGTFSEEGACEVFSTSVTCALGLGFRVYVCVVTADPAERGWMTPS